MKSKAYTFQVLSECTLLGVFELKCMMPLLKKIESALTLSLQICKEKQNKFFVLWALFHGKALIELKQVLRNRHCKFVTNTRRWRFRTT
jgi:hypothetical protein